MAALEQKGKILVLHMKGRARHSIDALVALLRAKGKPYLARCLRAAPQTSV